MSSPLLAAKKNTPLKAQTTPDYIEIHECNMVAQGSSVYSGQVCSLKKRESIDHYTKVEIPLDKVSYRRYSSGELSFYCKDEACIKEFHYNANNRQLLCEEKTNTYFGSFSVQSISQFKKEFSQVKDKCQSKVSNAPNGSKLKELQMLEHKEVWKANCENGKFAILAPLYWGGEYCGGYGDDFLCADTPEEAGKQLCQKLPN